PVTAAPSGAGYAVQFAAYNTKVGAQGFVAQLRARGIPARVEGEVAPFRVRAGRYPSRAEAEIAAQGWRTPGQAAIVVGYGGAP
ncbi:MAG: SPOR domain-containing protein, partial [Gemmatimonadaceae bacterium]|nr:SPOR domain-containing protein [Gemmatimonadaceae bacterium]